MNMAELIGTSTSPDGRVFFHFTTRDNRHHAAVALARAHLHGVPFSWLDHREEMERVS